PVPPINPPPVQSNPSLSLGVDKTVVAPGDTLTYTLTLAAGQAGLSRGALFAVVPPGTQWMDATGNGMLSGDTVVWSFGALPAGTGGAVAFRVRVAGSTPSGTVIQEQGQLLPGGQAVFVSSNVVNSIVATPGTPATLLTTADRRTARPGDPFTYRLSYANVSGTTVGNVQIVDPLPAGLLFLGADADVQVDVA